MILWQPSTQWLDEHTSSDLVYSVTVGFDSRTTRDAVLREVATGHSTDGPVVLDGGASVRPHDDRALVVRSGGEDALDSLEDCLNETVGGAITRLGITSPVQVLHQDRHLEP